VLSEGLSGDRAAALVAEAAALVAAHNGHGQVDFLKAAGGLL
jgi:hypothetical protein